MNFRHVLIGVAVLVVAIVAFKYFTRLDHSDPIRVATGFTKEMKSRDIPGASEYVSPDLRAAWLTEKSAQVDAMKSGTTENYFSAIPEDPGYTAPATGAAGGTMKLLSSDKSYSLELAQVDGKWYVAKAPN